MRFVAAIVSFVLAFVMIGLGIAQRTIFSGPDHVVVSTQIDSAAPVTLIDGATLNGFEGRQKLQISGSDEIFVASGRQSDVEAWIGDAQYNTVTIDKKTGELVSTLVPGKEKEVPSALGSDLWMAEYDAKKSLDLSLAVPDDIALLVMSTGVAPAPDAVSISWPLDNSTPWSGPLLVGGVIVLLLGLAIYLWALLHQRKLRGPRRTPPKQPKLPQLPKYNARKTAKAVKPGTPLPIESSKGRRAAGRLSIVVPTVIVGALLLGGCTASTAKPLPQAPSASPSAVADAEEAMKDPAVTQVQLARILGTVSEVATQSDADRNVELLGSRFEGPALEARAANYKIRTVDNSVAALSPIWAKPIRMALPQQTDAWPRVVLAVVQDPDDDTMIPTGYVLNQASPRENYKVQYAVNLQAGEVFPDVAAAEVGAVRYTIDNKFLKMTPDEVAKAYTDVIALGADSEFASAFDLENDSFLALVGAEAKAARAATVTGPASLTVEAIPGTGEQIALATEDTGAIIALSFGETEKVAPTEANAQITTAEGQVRLLSGVTTTTKGVYASYGYQLLFYVPKAGSTEKIRLLGSTQALIAAGEL